MQPSKFVMIALASLGAGAAFLVAQQPAEQTPPAKAAASPDEQALRATLAAYSTAYKANDVDRILAFWADDAEFVDEDGEVTKGRDALAKGFRERAASRNLADFQAKITSLRFLRGDLAMADGTIKAVDADGSSDSGAFQSLWTKAADGQWRILSVRSQVSDDETPENVVRLQPLERLIGEWVHRSGDTEITIKCRRANKQCFLVAEQSVKVKGTETLSNTIVIGWDPQEHLIRSWVFDSAGGFGSGLWQRRGNEFQVDSTGTRADGRSASSLNSWNFINDDTLEWSATDREIDGEALPDTNARYTRVKK